MEKIFNIKLTNNIISIFDTILSLLIVYRICILLLCSMKKKDDIQIRNISVYGHF